MPAFYIKDKDLIFLHNPKTGGRSIRLKLWTNVEGPFQGYVPEKYTTKYKFGFVRNPYNRLLSAWQHVCKTYNQNITLSSFFDYASNNEKIEWESYLIYNKEYKQTFSNHHILPQSDKFWCLDEADFIGKFETLQDDFDQICDINNINREIIPNPKEFKTIKNKFNYYVKNIDLLKKINNYYLEDFKKFNYKIKNKL